MARRRRAERIPFVRLRRAVSLGNGFVVWLGRAGSWGTDSVVPLRRAVWLTNGWGVGSHTVFTDTARLRRLRDCGLLDGAPTASLDRLARAAAHHVRAARAQVSLVTADRRVVAGQAGPPLTHSFCRIVVDTDAPLLVSDARTDDRLSGHPAIDDGVIAYAGFPIRSADGYPLGAFCVTHDQPCDWEPRALLLVEDLAAAAETEIALRAEVRTLRKLTALLARADLTPARRNALLDASRPF